jgi:chemotaxis protein histidine kinase CheA
VVRRLKQATSDKEREMDIMVQVLDAGVDVLHEFRATGRRLLAENRASLVSDKDVSVDALESAFRNLHTLKGNARLHGFTHLVDGLHSAEDAYDSVRRSPGLPVDKPRLLRHLDAVGELITEYEKVCRDKLAPLSKKSQERAERALQEISALVASAGGNDSSGELLSGIHRIVSRLETTCLADLVHETCSMLPSLATELGKPAPALSTHQAEVQLAPAWTGLVKDILVQCFRNSVYHGIEAPQDRLHGGKPAQGRIEVRARRTASSLELQLFDDGRGLALERLRQRTGDPSLSDEALAQQIFLPGVSTAEAVSPLAGRGIGLDIVRASLRARGGDAFVRFTQGERDGHRPFMMVLLLPGEAVVGSHEGAGESPAASGG